MGCKSSSAFRSDYFPQIPHCFSRTGGESDAVAGGRVVRGDTGVSISVESCGGVRRDELAELVLAGPCPGDTSAGQLKLY